MLKRRKTTSSLHSSDGATHDFLDKAFAGKTHLDNILIFGTLHDNDRSSDAPRPARNLDALNVERHRVARAHRDFGLRYLPSHDVDATKPEHGTHSQ
jgi:hypothetical protein